MNSEVIPVAVAAPYIEEQKVLSTTKFVVLCVLTAGLYTVWWQYKAWRFFKQRQQSDTWPAVRAIFSVFTIYELLKYIKQFTLRQSLPVTYNPGNAAAGYIILSLLSRLPDPLWVIAVFSCIPLISAHKAFGMALLVSEEVQAIEEI
jgi:hypothetical protein